VGGLPSNGASIDFDLEMETTAVYLTLAFRGVAAGLIIAAPVGPVNLLCVRRTLEKGWRSGMVSGFGAALADTAYGAIAGFGISLVIQFLIREEFWIRVIGGIFLMCLGVVYYRKPLRPVDAGEPDSSTNSDFISAFLLNATNPTTVLSFLAVLATLGVGRQSSLWQTLILVPGIFCGSMMWWTILACTASRLRSRISDGAMRWMNHLAGTAIGCFGLANVLLSRGMRR
jgi:threonine/homoserine/homoserine lactone efflux protein